mmetsp:Transcript_33150/g.97796  ORF Transcript_33150/g.97796 Transcript_33150/m.97796 type:complete len:351 (+) Transcript_33150:40-1092(+)
MMPVVPPAPNDGGGTPAHQRRQYVWLIRYGRTDPPLLENIGNYDSDLHKDGITHATAIAERLASGHHDGGESSSSSSSSTTTFSSNSALPKIVYSDPFLRCMRTADVVVKTLNSNATSSSTGITGTTRTGSAGADAKNGDDIKIRVEEGTTEWQVPSLLVDKDGKLTNPRSTEELVKLFSDTVDATYRSVNPQGPDQAADTSSNEKGEDEASNHDDGPSSYYPPRFPETEEQLHRRCQCTIRRILADVGGTESFAIVGHAPCVQSMALALMGEERPEDCPEPGPWSLGGMTLFSRPIGTSSGGEGGEEEGRGGTKSDKWTLEFYSDTTHMPGEYKDGKLGRWSLPSFDRS